MAAIEAGADIVDLSLAPVSGGTCQPDVATLWHALRGSEYELQCDIDAIMKVEESLKDALKDYFLPPEALHTDPRIPWSPMPGGALTANTQMLRDNGLMDKYGEIIVAMEEVVRKGGFGTSVTPVSQFYFQQAFNNVMQGPWKKIAEGYGKMVLGYFGKTPVPPDKKVVQIAAEQLGLKPTKEKVLTLNDKNPNKSRKHYEKMLTDSGLPITDENVFIVAACGEKGITYLTGKGKIAVRYKEAPKIKSDSYKITVGDESFDVTLKETSAIVNGKEYPVSVSTVGTAIETDKSPAPTGNAQVVKAGTPGVVTQILVTEGDLVKAGQNLCVLEVMKMESFTKASAAGKVKKIFVKKGDTVKTGDPLFELE